MTKLGKLLISKHGVTATAVALLAAAGAGGLVSADKAAKVSSARLTSARLELATETPPPAPAALQARLSELAAAYGEPVGIAVSDVAAGWTAGVDQDRPYPQQSVSKLWVAISVLKAADEGRLDPEAWVTLTHEDRSVFYQPIAYNIGPAGYSTQISSLLRRAISESDNAANDKLMQELGGPEGVRLTLESMGLTGVTVGAYERDLQALTAGLVWRPEYGVGWNFQAAREQLPRETREAALEAYLANPLDGAAPAAITAALGALHRGELLSEASTARLIGLMRDARTGPKRLKGGLPPGWTIAHKTGTGQDYRGASVGINNVGLITAPDGRTYAVAVMMRRTARPVPERLAFMQAVSRAVADEWARSGVASAIRAAD